jgi:hypothetical protein
MSTQLSSCLRASSHVVQIATRQRASQAAFMVSPLPVQQRPAPITVAPPSYTGSVNCDAAISISQSCEIASPGFDNLCFHDQQSCLCSTSGIWAPSYYDDYWSSCLAWASTSDASPYSLLGPHTNGVVQSRKCQTWGQLTATGGTPSNCPTSPSNVLSSTSLTTARPTTLVPATATGAAAGFGDMQVSVSLCKLLSITKQLSSGACVDVIINIVNLYLAV